MSLIHQFSVISQDSDEEVITKEMESVEIPDDLMQYISDSLNWIYSIWNGKEKNVGISYYGFSVIEKGEMLKFADIIDAWKQLFEFAPDNFCITGNFLLDENQYEKIFVKKKEILDKLDLLGNLCRRAVAEEAKILHNGI